MADEVIIEGDEAPEAAPVVVTVVTDAGGDDSTALDHESRLTALEVENEALRVQLAEAAAAAVVAQSTATAAIESTQVVAEIASDAAEVADEAAEEVDEAAADDTSEEVVPAKREHPFWSKPVKWRR